MLLTARAHHQCTCIVYIPTCSLTTGTYHAWVNCSTLLIFNSHVPPQYEYIFDLVFLLSIVTQYAAKLFYVKLICYVLFDCIFTKLLSFWVSSCMRYSSPAISALLWLLYLCKCCCFFFFIAVYVCVLHKQWIIRHILLHSEGIPWTLLLHHFCDVLWDMHLHIWFYAVSNTLNLFSIITVCTEYVFCEALAFYHLCLLHFHLNHSLQCSLFIALNLLPFKNYWSMVKPSLPLQGSSLE